MPKRDREEYLNCKECHLPFDGMGVKVSWSGRRMCNKCVYQIRYSISKWRKLNPEPADCLCPTCGRVLKYNHGFDVDHYHITKTIRGYLCHGCNVALGMVDDDPNTLINLAMRMGKHKTEHGLPF
jgi:hypothetical protein